MSVLNAAEKFNYQRQRKRESEERIFNAFGGKKRSFTELLKLSGLSRPILTNHLKRMVKEGKIRKKSLAGKRSPYELVAGALEQGYVKRTLFSFLSSQAFHDVFDATAQASLTDEEFIQQFTKKVGLIALLTLHVGLEIGRVNPTEGGTWIEEAFGTPIQKYAWRRCYFRQILGGEYELKHPVKLRKPVAPEFIGDLVKLPEAFEPGITAKIMEALPTVDDKRLRDFKKALEKAFPDDMETMDEVLELINVDTR